MPRPLRMRLCPLHRLAGKSSKRPNRTAAIMSAAYSGRAMTALGSVAEWQQFSRRAAKRPFGPRSDQRRLPTQSPSFPIRAMNVCFRQKSSFSFGDRVPNSLMTSAGWESEGLLALHPMPFLPAPILNQADNFVERTSDMATKCQGICIRRDEIGDHDCLHSSVMC